MYNGRSCCAAYKGDIEYNGRSCMSYKCASYMFTIHSVDLQTALALKIAWHERRLGER